MSKRLHYKTLITNLEQLNQLTQRMVPFLNGRQTIELISDLGGGKTAFVRSLAANLKTQDTVNSPSFTIENVYRCSLFDIHHFDFYRLDEAGICAYELQEAIANEKKLVIIEWGDLVIDLLPSHRLTIKITPQPSRQYPEGRLFEFKTTGDLEKLLASF